MINLVNYKPSTSSGSSFSPEGSSQPFSRSRDAATSYRAPDFSRLLQTLGPSHPLYGTLSSFFSKFAGWKPGQPIPGDQPSGWAFKPNPLDQAPQLPPTAGGPQGNPFLRVPEGMPQGTPQAPPGNAWGYNFRQQYGEAPGQMRDQWAQFRTANGIGGGNPPLIP